MRTFNGVMILLAILLTSASMSGCGKDGANIQAWLADVSKAKAAAEKEAPKLPYRTKQHKAFKAYFAEIEKLALALKTDRVLAGKLSGAMDRSDLNKICAQIFFTKDEWRDLMRGCTKNRFFLCSEEVRAYPNMVSAMRESLDEKQRKRFDQTTSCRNSF